MKAVQKFTNLFKLCQKSDSSFISVLFRHIIYKCLGKNILANDKVIIKGIKNITTNGQLQIGMAYIGFQHKRDTTFLNVNGRLIFGGDFSIGKGCRFDIGADAVVNFGEGAVNPNTNFIIKNGLEVGNDSVISWGCQFLDDDFHVLEYEGKKDKSPIIKIGNHVWIGSNVNVLKGSIIPDGCVVACGSVVSSCFTDDNCLIAGNPAKVIKQNVKWCMDDLNVHSNVP